MNVKKCVIVMSSLLSVMGCGDMNELHQTYLDRGETIYTGAIDSLEVCGGLNRAQLKWEMNADPRITDLVIRWNNKKDSVVLAVDRSEPDKIGIYKDSLVLDEYLSEGSILFQLYTRDNLGHTSVIREITGEVYGTNFASAAALKLPRKLEKAKVVGTDSVKLTFATVDQPTMVNTKIYYIYYGTDSRGEERVVELPNEETEVLLEGINFGDGIKYQSSFLPAENALDAFDGKLQSYQLPLELKLVWSEEFEGNGLLNEKFWMYDEGYQRNNELQDYKKADSRYARMENGKLILEAHKDPHDGINPWTGEPYHFEYSSAEVRTLNENGFLYGRLDVSAKIPTGRGVWPAIWLMPTDGRYGGWPDCGEIDVMEYVWGDDVNHNRVWCTLHTKDSDTNGNRISGGSIISETLSTEFHLYSLVWDEDKIEILFDDQSLFTYERKPGANFETWPFDRPFYLIMNIAVGGAWGGSWGIDESIFPARMEIDYVRYYQYR